MTRKARMEATLRTTFSPLALEVVDESAKHHGHAGARPEGETHYNVAIVADAFRGLSRVDRHRRVNAALAPEFDAGLHALAVSAKAPGE